MQDRIEKVVELAAPVARVWRALTNHKEFGSWFRVALEGPFVVGEVSRLRERAENARRVQARADEERHEARDHGVWVQWNTRRQAPR
jgi:uncharacterized protein YndB with AHSA1/START domain